MQWFTYILLCADGSYYVGHTEDLALRLDAHNSGRGAIHTKGRLPVHLAYCESHPTAAAAIARERQLKGWSRAKKQALIDGQIETLRVLAKRQGG